MLQCHKRRIVSFETPGPLLPKRFELERWEDVGHRAFSVQVHAVTLTPNHVSVSMMLIMRRHCQERGEWLANVICMAAVLTRLDVILKADHIAVWLCAGDSSIRRWAALDWRVGDCIFIYVNCIFCVEVLYIPTIFDLASSAKWRLMKWMPDNHVIREFYGMRDSTRRLHGAHFDLLSVAFALRTRNIKVVTGDTSLYS